MPNQGHRDSCEYLNWKSSNTSIFQNGPVGATEPLKARGMLIVKKKIHLPDSGNHPPSSVHPICGHAGMSSRHAAGNLVLPAGSVCGSHLPKGSLRTPAIPLPVACGRPQQAWKSKGWKMKIPISTTFGILRLKRLS
jgi:hypothetical protein